ncbi:site-specific integrase [Halomonas sp. SL1]|uniref:site-specific integrase n=1 Tax=Halomonas sp. SL1 TaxID=2137478 RepID=UPI000D15E742|nr:site-specific integrase [Halomonas sp. SL1]RAH36733.1 DUF4102 domain-containing protein [Halomonas sp. SL1]
MAATKDTRKLTKRVLDKLNKDGSIGQNVWDSELTGFHVRVRKGALSFRVSYYNVLGERRVVTLGRYGATMDAGEAREAAKEALLLVSSGQDPRQIQEQAKQEIRKEHSQTLKAYLEGPYTAFQNRRKDGSGTLRRIRKDFEEWLDKPLYSLTRADVEQWQADEEAKEKPRAFLTLKRSYDALHALLVHAAEREVIPDNPLKGIKLQKPALKEEDLIEEANRRRYLEKHEVKALFLGLSAYQEQRKKERQNSRSHGKAYLPSLDNLTYVDHVEPYILLMYYTGFRPGDLFGLRWEHINFQNKSIRKIIEKTSHHNQAPMTFPVSDKALKVLKIWNNQHGAPSKGYVFPSTVTGKRMDSTSMQKPWKTVKKLSGLPDDLPMYALRHNFASQLVMSGVDLLTVSKLMAHADIQTTIAHYAHLSPDHTRDAVEGFSNLINIH